MKKPVDISRVFHPVFWWLERGSLQRPRGSTLLRRPPECFTRPYPAGRQQPEGSLPPQKPQAWEVGGGVGKPKIQPSSDSHPPL